MKNLKKIIIGVVCWMMVAGFLLYEGYSIVKKEYMRQTEIAAEAHEKINFNLDMIKIAVLTEDVETYENNLAEMKDQMAVISPLGLIHDEQVEYLESLGEYTELLNNKVELLKEMQKAKTEIVAVKEKMNENYSNKDTLTRDKLKEVKNKVAEFKVDTGEFTEERVLKTINAVNGILDGVIDKSAALADCIDTCYKNRISEINNELADKIKSFADAVDGLNTDLEKEFNFDLMQEIRDGKKQEDVI